MIANALEGEVYRDGDLYTIEISELPAAQVAEVLHEIRGAVGDREILFGVETLVVDPETGEESPPEWRMLIKRTPAVVALGEGSNTLDGWSELATKRSRLLLVARALTARVYARPDLTK